MKSLLALMLSITFVVSAGTVLAEEKAYVPKDNEELYGTWVNMDYHAMPWKKKIGMNEDHFAQCAGRIPLRWSHDGHPFPHGSAQDAQRHRSPSTGP